MRSQNVVLRRFAGLAAAIVAGSLFGISATASGASAAPSPDPSTPSSDSTSLATRAEKMTVEDILRANPDARRVRTNAVNISPGIDVILPPADGDASTLAEAELCDYYHLCVWEHSIADGFGVGLGFYDCQPSGVVVNLGAMRYPDGASVGTGASGPKWNDRISSFENNQTPGTATSFYNWTGSWTNVLDSYAFDRVSNLRYTVRGNVNDIIDAVHVCTS
ncbi:hypothetical protein [Plantactinospora sp. B24E8]|uniref:hypothetical protein n=1 Tax=Plantactinospora sp. B24E8 TaxID=3153567 RepID=UPI00325CDE19